MENNYIEQLSELLQLNKRGDMTSTKPDKAAILNQVVKTVSNALNIFRNHKMYWKNIKENCCSYTRINRKT